jgi:hypothetical protein
MARVNDSKAAQAEKPWNQPPPFRIEFTFTGLRVDCGRCQSSAVTWHFLGVVDFKVRFRFVCTCGNVAERPVFNGTSGF